MNVADLFCGKVGEVGKMKLKKVPYEEPLQEGKVPKSYAHFNGEIYECVRDEWDIDTNDPEEHETDTFIIKDSEEFYDYVTRCKACGTDFIAYDENGLTRNYCPGCGKNLQGVK